jgi:hypothetical protein
MSLMLPVEDLRFEEANKVLELYVQKVNPTKIARDLGIKRTEVLAYIEEWKESKIAKDYLRDRTEELVGGMDDHYDTLIRKAYEIVDEVDAVYDMDDDEEEKHSKRWGTMSRAQMLSQKKGALDLIAKLEKDRIDMLSKLGLGEMDALGDELVRMEEEKQIILDILANDLCPKCHPVVMAKIGQMLGGNQNTVVVVQQPDE